MEIRLSLKPGQKGTKKLVAEYGERLVCVRYRYDEARRRRYKTVELIVEEQEWLPAGARYGVRVEWGEIDLARRVKAAGGEWDGQRKVRLVDQETVTALGLEARVTGLYA
jgi:hypothetical protein